MGGRADSVECLEAFDEDVTEVDQYVLTPSLAIRSLYGLLTLQGFQVIVK